MKESNLKTNFYLIHDLGENLISEGYDYKRYESRWHKTFMEFEPKDEKICTNIKYPCECISCKEIVEVDVNLDVTAYIPKDSLAKIFFDDYPLAKEIISQLFIYNKIDLLGYYFLVGLLTIFPIFCYSMVVYNEGSGFSWLLGLLWILGLLLLIIPILNNLFFQSFKKKFLFPKKFGKYHALLNVGNQNVYEYLSNIKDVRFFRYIGRADIIGGSNYHLLSPNGNLKDYFNNKYKSVIFFNKQFAQGFTSKSITYYERMIDSL